MNVLLRCQRFWTGVTFALIFGVIANLTGCAATQMGPNQVPPGKHLQSIAIAPQTAAVALGNNLQFSATALFSDGSKTDVTGTAAWISTQPKVASMNPAGMAISKTTGTTSISAVYESVSASIHSYCRSACPDFNCSDASDAFFDHQPVRSTECNRNFNGRHNSGSFKCG